MNTPEQLVRLAQEEIADVFRDTDSSSFTRLAAAVGMASRVFVAGAGRSGLWAKAFAMRLAQAGCAVHVVGDATTPAIAGGDLLFLISGSGRTATLRPLADAARRQDATVAILTYRPDSVLAEMSGVVTALKVPLDAARPGGIGGSQRLGTLFDQCAMIALDVVAHLVAERANVPDAAMQQRHANLE